MRPVIIRCTGCRERERRGRENQHSGGQRLEERLTEVGHMKKVKDTAKKAKPKKPIQNKEAGKLDKAKITGLPGYTPGELPKR